MYDGDGDIGPGPWWTIAMFVGVTIAVVSIIYAVGA